MAKAETLAVRRDIERMADPEKCLDSLSKLALVRLRRPWCWIKEGMLLGRFVS